MLLFFLSHERRYDDELVRRFFDDLRVEVRHHMGLTTEVPVGFMDHEKAPMSDGWPEERLAALRECRAFVALLSPGYVASDECGREWAYFESRLARHPDDGPPSMLPLLWIPVEIPDRLAWIQYTDPLFSEVYLRNGLRQLMRIHRYRDDYLEFVTAVARRLAAIGATAGPPPPPTKGWSAFPYLRLHHPGGADQ